MQHLPASVVSDMKDVSIRKAAPRDADQFVALVRALAEYERLAPPGKSEVRRLKRDAFGRVRKLDLLMAFHGKEAVAYAAYFMTYSTFLARPTLYLEDIFVLPGHRRRGIGISMFSRLVSVARQRGCGRMEWSVLRWNQTALGFYRKIGATELSDWAYYRLTADRFGDIANPGNETVNAVSTKREGEA